MVRQVDSSSSPSFMKKPKMSSDSNDMRDMSERQNPAAPIAIASIGIGASAPMVASSLQTNTSVADPNNR